MSTGAQLGQAGYDIEITDNGRHFHCTHDTSVLAAMEQLALKGIPVGCRNGGCGVCKVQVVSGAYETRKMSRAVVSAEQEAQGCVLACKLHPRGDLKVKVIGKMARAVVAEKSASFGFQFFGDASSST